MQYFEKVGYNNKVCNAYKNLFVDKIFIQLLYYNFENNIMYVGTYWRHFQGNLVNRNKNKKNLNLNTHTYI